MSRKRPLAWRKPTYPWTPAKKDVPVQSFAAIRSGVLPILELNLQGQPELTFVDTRTKEGLAQYEAALKRGVQK